MSTEYINRISIKKDGVYVSTKSNNDNMPYHSVKIGFLSEIYREEGQAGLDRAIIEMCSEYCQLRGSHKSLDRYRYALNDNSTAVRNLRQEYLDAINDKFDSLSEEDKRTRWKPKGERTPAMNEYLEYEKKCKNELYTKLAERLENRSFKEIER